MMFLKKAVSLFFCILLLLTCALPVFANHSDVVSLVPPPDTSRAASVYVYHINSEMTVKI